MSAGGFYASSPGASGLAVVPSSATHASGYSTTVANTMPEPLLTNQPSGWPSNGPIYTHSIANKNISIAATPTKISTGIQNIGLLLHSSGKSIYTSKIGWGSLALSHQMVITNYNIVHRNIAFACSSIHPSKLYLYPNLGRDPIFQHMIRLKTVYHTPPSFPWYNWNP